MCQRWAFIKCFIFNEFNKWWNHYLRQWGAFIECFITCSNDGHSEKLLDPIEVTGERRDIFVNDEHLYNKYPGKNTIVPVISMDLIPSNIFLPNKVIDDGNDTRKDEQLPKALSPIEVTEEGMIISVKDEHP